MSNNNIFNPIEIDAIGEIMNISLGSSATAVSNMLDHRVDITTPKVTVENAEDFELGPLDPAIGVEIKYVAGLEGSNIMLLKLSDVKTIVDILMGSETPEEEFELNEFTLSAVREIMNQMMGAASTALSDFLGRMVNISTPETFDLNNLEEFKATRLPVSSGPLVRVSFNLKIEDSLESEFMNVMSIELARELVAGFGLGSDDGSVENNPLTAEGSSGVLNQDEIERLMKANEEANAAAAAQQSSDSGGGMLSQDEIEKLMSQSMGQSAPAPAPEPSSGGGKLSQDEIEKLMSQTMGQSAPTPAPAPEPSSGGGKLSQDEIEKLLAKNSAPAAAPAAPAAPAQSAQASAPAANPNAAGAYPQYPGGYPPYPYYMAPPQGWPQQPAAPEPKVITTQAVPMPKLEASAELGEEQAQNLDLIMSVPLEVTVEIGRTKRKVKDILTFAKGSLVVLDKLAGDQVDLFVNGKCIAKGDVVVIDDNFGIRITEIVKKPELEEITAKT